MTNSGSQAPPTAANTTVTEMSTGLLLLFGIFMAGWAIGRNGAFNYLPAYLVVSILLMLWFVALGVEQIPWVRHFATFKSTGLLLALLTTVLGTVGRAKASNEITSLFGVSASNFPYTLTTLTFLDAFIALKWLFFIVLVPAVLVAWTALRGVDESGEKGAISIVRAISAIVACALSIVAILGPLNDRHTKSLVYYLAQSLDFRSKVFCSEVALNDQVAVFVGDAQDKVLVAPALASADLWERMRSENEASGWLLPLLVPLPTEFPVLECGAAPAKQHGTERPEAHAPSP
jgi:hypothetical protein